MEIEDIPEVKVWIDQFDLALPDRYLAKFLLKKMRYVSLQTVETWLQSSVLDTLKTIEKTEGGRVGVAIYPVSKPFLTKYNNEKEVKPTNDSSGRLAHSLKNLERRLSENVVLTPRVETLKEMKVKHIIFVDDFIGTGKRFIKSWRETVS